MPPSCRRQPHRGAARGRADSIGSDVTVGHRAIVHGCSIGDFTLIGMGAIVMDGAARPYTLLGAGSLVPEGKLLDGRALWRGAPARRVRDLTDAECEMLRGSASHYAELAAELPRPGPRAGSERAWHTPAAMMSSSSAAATPAPRRRWPARAAAPAPCCAIA